MGIFDRLTERFEGFLDDVFIPEGLRSLLERASRLMQRGNYEQALSLLEQADTDYSDHHRTCHLLGQCQFHLQNFPAARQALERAAELRDEPATHFYAGLAAEQLDEPREAKLHFQRALSLAEETPFEFDLYFGLGRVLLAMGRTERAIHELEKALGQDGEEPELVVTLARALIADDRADRALELLDGLSGEEMGREGLMLRARVTEETDAMGAAEQYQRVLEADAGEVEAMLGAGRAYLAAGSPAKAQQYLLQTLQEADAPATLRQAHTLLGDAYAKIGEYERALEHYRQTLAIEADAAETEVTPRARLGAGRALQRLGEVDEAADHFDVLIDEQTDLADRARLGLAESRLAQDRVPEARRLLDEIEAPDAFDGDLEHLAGRIAMAGGDAAEALVAYQNALHATDSPSLRSRIETDRQEALHELTPDWELPESIEGPLDIEAVLAEVRRFLDGAPPLDHFQPPVRELTETMSDPLSVAIVGEFNAGKSTLVNALVGEEVVPMGVLPTTAHTCFIRYGPRKTARVVYKDDEGEPGAAEEVDFAEARRRMEEETDRIAHLEFLYPHPQLRSIHFWDTPGFNALEEGHDGIASRALDEAEAILWVFDAKQTLSQSELERLRQIPESDERLVVLLNKADELRRREVEEVEDYLDEEIGSMVAGHFAVSARRALETADGADEEVEPETFEAFRSFLDRMFVQRAGRIKTLEVRRRLAGLVDRLRREVDDLIGTRRALVAELEEVRDWIDRAAQQRPDELAEREADSVADQFDFAVEAVAREMNDDLRPSGTILAKMTLDEEDRRFALDVFRRRLDDVLARSLKRARSAVSRVESGIAGRIGGVVEELSVANARSVNRRLDGFYDEGRAMLLLLDERVYGQLEARLHGAVETGGARALEAVGPIDEEAERLAAWKEALRGLLPDARNHVNEQLSEWYREFFLVARRFSDRVHRDLQLLQLEAEYRYETSRLRDLLREP